MIKTVTFSLTSIDLFSMDDLSIFQNKAPIVYKISNVILSVDLRMQIRRQSRLHNPEVSLDEPIDALEVFSIDRRRSMKY